MSGFPGDGLLTSVFWRRVMVDPEQHKTSLNLLFIPPSYPVLSVVEWQHMFLFADRTQLASSITCGNAA